MYMYMYMYTFMFMFMYIYVYTPYNPINPCISQYMIEILTKQHRHGISIRRNETAVMGLGVTPSIISKPALMPKLGEVPRMVGDLGDPWSN